MIQNSQSLASSRPLVSRFTILLLAAVLICLDWGRSLPAELTDYFSLVGLAGMAMYISLEFVAISRASRQAQTLRCAAEVRLAKHSDPMIGIETDVWEYSKLVPQAVCGVRP